RLVPSEAFGRVAADEPEKHQLPRDLGRFRGTVALDEPSQAGAVALKIFTYAIQPFDLRRSNQPLPGEDGFRRAIADQPLQRLVTLARSDELERPVRTHGLEHVVQRTRRNYRGVGSQQKTLVDQTRRCTERLIGPRRTTLTTGKDRRGRVNRKQTGQSAEAAEGALLLRVEQLITPGDRCVHRLL